MHVVILAGGLATRMRPQTETIPKSLLAVAGRPFVDAQLEWLRSAGVEHVVFSIGHLGGQIENHVGTGERYGISVAYVSDGDRLLGTAGALRRVVDSGLVPDRFGVLNGDSYLSLDIGAIEESFERSGKRALMTVMHNRDRWERSNVVFQNGMVLNYDKHASDDGRAGMEWIDYGFVVLTGDLIRNRVPASAEADLSKILHDMSLEGELAGFEVTERFYEIGSPAGLRGLEEVFRSGTAG
jgi:N-acetyl-alpha-D-muramate 1-phosphate uridylyltransferase